jgi:hypothetical protein
MLFGCIAAFSLLTGVGYYPAPPLLFRHSKAQLKSQWREIIIMPDAPKTQPALPRSRVVEIIDRAQEDALRQLRQDGVPEAEALAVIRRFSAFAIQVLRELDLLYRELAEVLAQDPDRSAEFQAWLDTKAGGLLLALESFIAAVVTEASNKAKENYRSGLSPPREVITPAPAAPRHPPWQASLWALGQALTPWLLLLAGFGVWFLVWWLVSGSLIIAVIAIGVTLFMGLFFELVGLCLSAVMGGLCLILILVFTVLEEGGL